MVVRNRKLSASVDYCLSKGEQGNTVARGVQTYQTTLSNSLGYTDGWASSIWPMGTNQTFHNTGSSLGGDFGELTKLNYDYLIHLYDGRRRPGNSTWLSSTLEPGTISCPMRMSLQTVGGDNRGHIIGSSSDGGEGDDGISGSQRIRFGWNSGEAMFGGWNHAVFFGGNKNTIAPAIQWLDAPYTKSYPYLPASTNYQGYCGSASYYMQTQSIGNWNCSPGGYGVVGERLGKEAIFEFVVSGTVTASQGGPGPEGTGKQNPMDSWAMRVGLQQDPDGRTGWLEGMTSKAVGYQAYTSSCDAEVPDDWCNKCPSDSWLFPYSGSAIAENDHTMQFTIQLGRVNQQTNPYVLKGEGLQGYCYSAWVRSDCPRDDLPNRGGCNIMRWSSAPDTLGTQQVEAGENPPDRWRIVRNWNTALTNSLTGELFGPGKVDYQREILYQRSNNYGPWETFWFEDINTLYLDSGYYLSTGVPVINNESQALAFLNYQYYPVVDVSASLVGGTGGSGTGFKPFRVSFFDSASMTNFEGNYAGSPPEWSASISYNYPGGFLTNDLANVYGTSAKMYKDYGLLWDVSNERKRILGTARYPSYNSYNDYAEDIRVMGKQYSILPEFKISDFVGNGYIRGPKYGLLSLPGGNITSSYTSSADATTFSNQNFFKEYSTTDFLSDFELVDYQLDEAGIGEQTEISINCKGILKLLPYDGFYPLNRSTQLATKFDDAFNSNFRLFKYEFNTGQFKKVSDKHLQLLPHLEAIRKQGMVTPFFAPGILYNSIKSGVGVGWTLVTSSCLADAYYMQNAATTPYPNGFTPSSIPAFLNGISGSIALGGFLNTVVYNSASAATKLDFESLYKVSRMMHGDSASFQHDSVVGAYHVGYPEAMQGYFPASPTASLKPQSLYGVSYRSGSWCMNDSFCDDLSPGIVHPGVLRAASHSPTPLNDFYMVGWDGDKTVNTKGYTLAMNNFLASTVRFFLEDPTESGPAGLEDVGAANYGQLNYFQSLPVNDIAHNFRPGRKFFMDIVMYRGSDASMCRSGWEAGQYLNVLSASDPFPRNQGALDLTAFHADDTATFTNVPAYPSYTVSREVSGSFPERAIYNTPSSFNGRYFGPATRKYLNLFNWESASIGAHYNVSDPAQAPYTPPYYYGVSRARIEYTPGTEWNEPDLANPLYSFFEKMITTYSNQGIEDKIKLNNLNYVSANPDWTAPPNELKNDTFSTSSFAYSMAQNIGDSVSIQGIKNVLEKTVNGAGVVQTIKNEYKPQASAWVISTKFESPMLDFSNQAQSTMTVQGGLHPTQSIMIPNGFLDNTPVPLGKGMWSGYGTYAAEPSVLFELQYPKDVPQTYGGYNTNMIEAFGFADSRVAAINGPTLSKGLGRLAESRTISEAVVAIPFVTNPIEVNDPDGQAITVGGRDSTRWENTFLYQFLNNSRSTGNKIDLFEIDQDAIDGYMQPSSTPLPQNSITDLIKNLNKFVFPVEMDFIHNPEVMPFVMYVIPFTRRLERVDLQDIWQGVLPEIGVNARLQEREIRHSLTGNAGLKEFFHAKKIPPKVRWLVFKVKQRGDFNYNQVTQWNTDDLDNSLFTSPRPAAGQWSGSPHDTVMGVPTLNQVFSYNWPHDFYSLVELSTLEAKIKFSKK